MSGIWKHFDIAMFGQSHSEQIGAVVTGFPADEYVDLNSVLNSLEESQKGDRRHRSPHAAYSLGYYNGVIDSYK